MKIHTKCVTTKCKHPKDGFSPSTSSIVIAKVSLAFFQKHLFSLCETTICGNLSLNFDYEDVPRSKYVHTTIFDECQFQIPKTVKPLKQYE